MAVCLDAFKKIWFVDFEFSQPDGELPRPVCMVARELRTGRTIRLFGAELRRDCAPFSVGPDSLFVAYYASAELGCFLALGWPLPCRILDLFAEFRCHMSGLPVPCGNGLLGALTFFGLDAIEPAVKDAMRLLAIRGEPYTAIERRALLDYCQTDVDSLVRLLPRMLPHLDIPRALLRGRYMAAAARMERIGIPIDAPLCRLLRAHWEQVQDDLIHRLDKWEIWEGRTFRAERFAAFLQRNAIPWPRLPSGALALDDSTFRTMARAYPGLETIRELRHSLSELRLNSLAVGSDGRNRCLLSAFAAKTGRNQPSNARFIFGPSVWLRGLIRPSLGQAVAYVDWEQQEFGIAAALSGDSAMQEAYLSGDPYLAFAKQARAVPPDATKETHPKERSRFKVCALGVQYGMGEQSLAMALSEPVATARELLRLHRQTYGKFWQWSASAVSFAMLSGCLHTVFGWTVHVGPDVNPRSLANFPMQGNGAEMLRLACCMATEQEIRVCAPVHDALLIESDIGRIGDKVRATQDAMQTASRAVLNGFPLRTEAKIISYPERYADDRGREMWQAVTSILHSIQLRGNTRFGDTLAVPETDVQLAVSGIPAPSIVW